MFLRLVTKRSFKFIHSFINDKRVLHLKNEYLIGIMQQIHPGQDEVISCVGGL